MICNDSIDRITNYRYIGVHYYWENRKKVGECRTELYFKVNNQYKPVRFCYAKSSE